MKAKVVKAFTDKNTGKIHLAGEAIDLKEARAKELERGGFVDIETPKAQKADKKE